MSSSNGVFAHQRNAHRNANAGTTTLKRRFDNRGHGGVGGFQEDRIRHAPPQKRPRYQTQTQTQFQSAKPGRTPLYHHHHHGGSNVSRFSNYGDVMIDSSNSSNSFPFALRNNDSSSQSNAFGYGNPNPNSNPQFVPLPLPYRKLDDFDSLPEWVPNRFVPNTNRDVTGVRFNANTSLFTNLSNSMPMMNHTNMVSIVSQAMPQPIVSKELADLLSVLKQNSDLSSKSDDESPSLPLGLDFDQVKLNVRHESVIKSLYSDMPRQCSSCGVRFKCQEEHSKHMDWHVRKNRTAKTAARSSQKQKKSRDWFASSSLWLVAATGGAAGAAKASFGETQKAKAEEGQQQQMVRADENQKMCALCVEPFEEFFSHEDDDWMYKDAVYLKGNELGPIVHAKCMPETRKGSAKDSRETMVKPVAVPSVASALVC